MSVDVHLNATIAGLSLGTIGSAITFFDINERKTDDIALARKKALLETIVVSAGASLIAKSWWPLLAPLLYITADNCFWASLGGLSRGSTG